MTTSFPKDLTKDEIVNWLGSDITKEGLLNLLLEIANGYYEPHILFNNIREYSNGST
jgi:hypothetical protein